MILMKSRTFHGRIIYGQGEHTYQLQSHPAHPGKSQTFWRGHSSNMPKHTISLLDKPGSLKE